MIRGRILRGPFRTPARAALVAFVPLWIVACGSSGEDAVIDTTGPCTGARLPDGQYYVQSGLCVRAVANQQGGLRQIMFAPNGDLLGVRKGGEIVRFRDENGDGLFEGGEIRQIAATGGANGNNAHIDGGYLYAGSSDGVKRWSYSADAADLGPGEDVVVGQLSTGTHKLHTVHVYDGWLYVHSGSEDNAVAPASPEYDTNRAVLKRFRLADFVSGQPFVWAAGEVFVRGIRNMVGFTRSASGRMYGVVNGLDNLTYGGVDVHNDNPGEDLISLESGGAHGYPYCFTAQRIMTDSGVVPAGTQLASAIDPEAMGPDFTNPQNDGWCSQNSTAPITFMPAHSAPLDVMILDASSPLLPAAWQGGALVALHGSWNTTPSVGHQVIFIPFDDPTHAPLPVASTAGTAFPHTVLFGGGDQSGSHDGFWGWSSGEWGETPVRPVGVAVSPIDGALYVSSDNAGILGGPTAPSQGVLYRIRKDR